MINLFDCKRQYKHMNLDPFTSELHVYFLDVTINCLSILCMIDLTTLLVAQIV
jgi:hypothetical protein